MRIAFIVPSNVPYGIQLANGLSSTHKIRFITTHSGREILPLHKCWQFSSLLRDLLLKEIELYDFPYRLLRDTRGFLQSIEIVRAVRDFHPDVVHLHQTADPRICTALLFLRKYPLVLTLHDVVWQHGARSRARDFLHNFPIRLADDVIVHGESLRTLFLRGFPSFFPENVHVIPIGVHSIYKKWGVENSAEKPETIVFFGRMYPYKGLATMIETAKLLASSRPSARIVIAGTGPELTRLRPQLDCLHNIAVYDHFIENELVAHLFQEACAVALPYEDASQSAVVAIAYAFNKPVVVTNVGALSEVVEDGRTGFVVPARDVRLFADALCRLLQEDDLRAQMKQHIRRKSETELSWETIALQTGMVYQHAIQRRSSPR